MQFDREMIPASVIFIQAYHRAHSGIGQRYAGFFCRIEKSPVVTRRISAGEKLFRVRASFFASFFQRIAQFSIEHSVRRLH